MLTLIDDDQSVRESLPELLRESGYEVDTFASAEAFLASGDPGRAKCLIVDVVMPGMSGPELQRELKRRGQSMPVIFITANVARPIREKPAMGRISMRTIALVALLGALSTSSLSAQDKYTVKVPGGLAFAEFRG